MKRPHIIKLLSLLICLVMVESCLASCGDSKTEATNTDAQQTEIITDSSYAWYKESPILAAGTDAFDYSSMPEQSEEDTRSIYEYYYLPTETVESMSSQGLLITTLDYPMIILIYAYNSFVQGYERVKVNCSSLAELVKRDGTAEMLDAFYASVDYAEVKKTDDSYIMRMRVLEMIIADDDVVSKADSKTRAGIIKSGIEKIAENQKNYDEEFGTNSTLYMISKYLYYDSEEFKQLVDSDVYAKNFVSGEDSDLSTNSKVSFVQILKYANKHIKNMN